MLPLFPFPSISSSLFTFPLPPPPFSFSPLLFEKYPPNCPHAKRCVEFPSCASKSAGGMLTFPSPLFTLWSFFFASSSPSVFAFENSPELEGDLKMKDYLSWRTLEKVPNSTAWINNGCCWRGRCRQCESPFNSGCLHRLRPNASSIYR